GDFISGQSMAVDHEPAATPEASSRSTSTSAPAGDVGAVPRPSSAANSMPAAWRFSMEQGAAPPNQRPEPGPFRRGMRAVGYRATELLNVCAAYLGIAVLVAVA